MDTGADWVPAACRNVTIDRNPVANTIDHQHDGGLIQFSVAGVFAGPAVEQVVLLCEDCYSASGYGDFDNLVATAEPTSVLLLVIGGLAMILRR